MSLEQSLERIATALETIAAAKGSPSPAAPMTASEVQARNAGATKPAKETKAPKGAPTVVPEPSVDEMFGKDEPAAAAVTFETLETRLREHAKAFGTKMTLDLMKKHGADPVTPKLKTIPENNYEACYVEADTDLKKVKK